MIAAYDCRNRAKTMIIRFFLCEVKKPSITSRNVPSGEVNEAVPHLWKSNKTEIKY